MRILFVTAVMAPFHQVGERSEVIATLAQTLVSLGHEVTVIMPGYASLDYHVHEVESIELEIPIPVGRDLQVFSVATTEWNGVKMYFLENFHYFMHHACSSDVKSTSADNGSRFTSFSRAALETIRALNIQPDVIHAHEWQASPVLAYLKTTYRNHVLFRNISTVLTIHNIEDQGRIEAAILTMNGLPKDVVEASKVSRFGLVSYLKMGITYADVITTVSPRYAQEITEKEYGYQLHEILGRRQNDLVGIVNGLDENEWTPAFDSYIPSTYSLKNLAGKKECRAALLDECWLEASDSTAIVAMISPLTEMKGIELVKQAIPQFASMNIRFILLGMGNRRQYDEIDALHAQYEDSFHSIIRRDRRMSHLIMAGADILLKPSKSEPGGLDQLIAMAYGTIPVVHDTGGLAETVIDVDDDPTNGSGFVFKEYTVESMIAAVRRSIEYLGTTEWQNLMKHDMSLDFSWRNSADQYVELYNTKLFSAGRDTSTSPTAM